MKSEYFSIDGVTVKNCSSPMKVGTDSVLLGKWIEPREEDKRFLDIGTGTGIILLMVANKVYSLSKDKTLFAKSYFLGIDIDKDSVEEARFNFASSQWSSQIASRHISLQEFCIENREISEDDKFDHIFSNPPFFINSLKAPDQRRSNARHAESLPFIQIIEAAFLLLKRGGRLSLILPCEQADDFRKEAELYHVGRGLDRELRLVRCENFASSPNKPPKRTLMEFCL